jgi:Ca2+:H+ antiporter
MATTYTSAQTDGRPESSHDDRHAPGLLSVNEEPPEQYRTHLYPGTIEHAPRVRSPRFLRPFFSLTNRVSRRTWSRIPDNLESDDDDDDDDSDHSPLRKSHGSSFSGALREMLLSTWLNGLLVFVPIGLLTYLLKMNPILVFVMNVIAIVPLSALLTEATEKIAKDAGDTIGALLNISLGNLVELILFVVALVNNHIRIVQASILGSILVNLLLILGSALLASSFRNFEPLYNTAETQLLSCLLFVSVFVFLMPVRKGPYSGHWL